MARHILLVSDMNVFLADVLIISVSLETMQFEEKSLGMRFANSTEKNVQRPALDKRSLAFPLERSNERLRSPTLYVKLNTPLIVFLLSLLIFLFMFNQLFYSKHQLKYVKL
jgi:hypothetical protein